MRARAAHLNFDMNTDSNLDRESFQRLLESAFVVQQSRIDPRFLSSILEVERLITRGELDVDGAMNLVADSAREVAGAAGVAIGLLDGDRLTYRAGSGCGAAYVGSWVGASLTVAKTKASREILRVENAHTDRRIEGEVCRQFGAASLLILPIYVPPIGRDRILAGVVMVLFSEAHIFQESEIRTYRLMAGLIETALSPVNETERNLPTELPATAKAVEQAKKQIAEPPGVESKILSRLGENTIFQRCGKSLKRVRASRTLVRSRDLKGIVVKRVTMSVATVSIAGKPFAGLALAAVAVALGLTFWMTHGNRGATSTLSSPIPQAAARSGFDRGDVIPVEAEAEDQSAMSSGSEGKSATAEVRRAWVAGNEIVYIGDDVTVRHFNYKPATQRSASRVIHIGNDVSVRYFTP